MKNLFISQPMNGLSNEEILQKRNIAIEQAKDILGDDVNVIDSFQGVSEEHKPLWYLGESLKFLSSADVAYFTEGWINYRGCMLEHICAEQYGIDIIDEEMISYGSNKS